MSKDHLRLVTFPLYSATPRLVLSREEGEEGRRQGPRRVREAFKNKLALEAELKGNGM